MGMKIVVAPDSFKGVLTASEAASAIAAGIRDAMPDADAVEIPIADGGEGTASALASSCGAEYVEADAVSPLGLPMKSGFYYDSGSATAFIDLAAASGLPLVPRALRDPLRTSTFGTGMLVSAALRGGAKRIVVGVGGSATVDAGIGALQALGARFLDETGDLIPFPACGADVESIRNVDVSEVEKLLSGTEMLLATDVTAPFTGPTGAARVFAPQKGADKEGTERLEKALNCFKELLKSLGFIDVFFIPGSGAAGGFAGGMASMAGAKICRGAELVINATGLPDALRDADLLITGEGKSDRQTLMDKAPYAAMKAAEEMRVPAVLLSGVIEERETLIGAGFADAVCINDGFPSGEDALTPSVAGRRLRLAARALMARSRHWR